jgi:hypothetical protein
MFVGLAIFRCSFRGPCFALICFCFLKLKGTTTTTTKICYKKECMVHRFPTKTFEAILAYNIRFFILKEKNVKHESQRFLNKLAKQGTTKSIQQRRQRAEVEKDTVPLRPWLVLFFFAK